MSKESPYHERSKGLIGVPGGGTDGRAVTIHGEGQYPDGQPQQAVDLAKVHRGDTAHYAHKHGFAYREDLRERPSAPSPHRPKPHKARRAR